MYANRGAFEKYCVISDRYEAHPNDEEIKAEFEKVSKDADEIHAMYLAEKERRAQ